MATCLLQHTQIPASHESEAALGLWRQLYLVFHDAVLEHQGTVGLLGFFWTSEGTLNHWHCPSAVD